MARLAATTVVEILQDRARSIAERLKLDYEYRFTGYGDMEAPWRRCKRQGWNLPGNL
jgi:hypothetical protein